MKTITRTDREQSLSADEFVWDTDGCTEAHDYVATPILAQLERAKAKDVLDLGCGNGSFSNVIAQKGYTVTGLDYSRSGIERAQKQYPGVQFGRHDLNEPLDREHHGRYDVVVAVEVIEHLLLPRKLLTAAAEALEPGGLFVMTTPFHGYWKNLALALTGKFDHHWHPLRDYGHVKFFSKATALELMGECGFTDLHFETVGRLPAFARSMVVSGRKPR
jgi:2-polyprenyl-3-methyl-5-hydroxy-6-metoxy-1,4-benzoquinol methylase